jgi:hypothetical protein
MSTEYDPKLQALFDQAQQSFDRDAFTSAIIERVDRERRRLMLTWSALVFIGVIVLAALAKPVFAALVMATQLLPVSLVDIEAEWLRLLVSPVNSVAAVVAVGILGIRWFFRRFVG